MSRFLITTVRTKERGLFKVFQDKNVVRFLSSNKMLPNAIHYSMPEQAASFIYGLEYAIQYCGGEIFHHFEDIKIEED